MKRPYGTGKLIELLSGMLTDISGRATDASYAAGWAGVKALPAPVASRVFQAAADLTVSRGGVTVEQLRKNMRRVGDPNLSTEGLDLLVKRAMRSYARYWLETFRLPKMTPAQVLAHVQTYGVPHLDKAIADGQGVILALPHTGNWDIAGLWLVDHGEPFTTVAERLRPQSLFDRFVAYRESIGMRVLPLTGGERPPFEVLAERLRAGEVICLLGDRDLSRRGVPVTFFGEPTRMPAGPAMLAATTGAALLPVTLHYTPEGWGQQIYPPLAPMPDASVQAVRATTQALADAFVQGIAQHPADWHMLQPLWLADLDPARLHRAESDPA